MYCWSLDELRMELEQAAAGFSPAFQVMLPQKGLVGHKKMK